MFEPNQVIKLDSDPLADRDTRTGVVVSGPDYDDWDNEARYNVVCLTTDFDEYSSNEHTNELHKDKHTARGQLNDHSLVCPWATVALPGSSLRPVGDTLDSQKVMLSDTGHEIVSRTVYGYFTAHNDY